MTIGSKVAEKEGIMITLPQKFERRWPFYLITVMLFLCPAVFLMDLLKHDVSWKDVWLLAPFLLCYFSNFDFTTQFYGQGPVLSRRSRLRPSTNGQWDLSKAVSMRRGGYKWPTLTLYGAGSEPLVALDLMLFDFDTICTWAEKSLMRL